MRWQVQILVALTISVFAVASIWFGVTGLLNSAVEFPTRFSHALVLRGGAPTAYWICVALWFAAGVGFGWLALANFREAISRAA